jgi:phosphoribosylaminoimidazolecarboxamide formyltransferase/IMP cyclohydrolase
VATVPQGDGAEKSDGLLGAYQRALACDPVSAFGGIVAVNRPLDRASAEAIVETFTEVVIAPDADEAARGVFAAKKNLRLLLTGAMPDPASPGQGFRSVSGGFLVQSRDTARLTAADLKVVTRRAPSPTEIEDMLFAFTIAKHVKSNAIVFARNGQTLGVGAGQMNRKDSARIAAMRAADFGLDLKGSACASEAFFPFADGLIQAAEAGATAVIQPGGSIRDEEVIAAADAAGIAMVFTGVRVFRH